MKNFLFLILAFLGLTSFSGNPAQCKKVKYANRAEAIAAQIHDPNSKYVVVISHRGDWRNFPENSALAIESVIKMGVDIMELDLKMSKDSVLVLSHDNTLNRCSTGKGPVSDYTLEELKKFKLRRAHAQVIDTARILTLEQALSICKDRICVNVDQGYQYYDKVLEIAEKLGVTDQILIKGKKPIEVVAANEAKYARNMMYLPIVDIQTTKGMALYKSYMDSGVVPLAYEVCWQKEDGTFEKVCKEIIAQGSKVWVNTLWPTLCGGLGNDDDAAYLAKDPGDVYKRYLDNGVSMIQTDRPEFLVNYLTKIGRHTLK